MSETRIIKGAKEAVAVAKGERPAARIYVNGHAYIPEALEFRPPIPESAWAEMVERGAGAVHEEMFGSIDFEIDIERASVCLRAALGLDRAAANGSSEEER